MYRIDEMNGLESAPEIDCRSFVVWNNTIKKSSLPSELSFLGEMLSLIKVYILHKQDNVLL